MTRKHSIRTRIYRLFAAFTLFTCLSYSLLLLAYSWVVEDNVFNKIVENEARYIETQYETTGQLVPPRAQFLTLHDSWEALPGDIYRQHLSDPARIEFPAPDGGTWHLRPLHLGDETRILVADVSAFEVGGEYLPYVTLTLVGILALFSALALMIAWPVARAASKPLVALKDEVEAIDVDKLEPGFAASFPDNEIGYLARQIEHSLLQVKAMLKRESDFTRDVSHELRTPTTILKNLARQSEGETLLSAKQTSQLKAAVQELEQTINTLLALAREESQTVAPVVFLHALENSVVRHPDLASRDDFDLVIDIPADLTVSANANLLTMLINNLLNNALHHSAAPRLDIRAHDRKIVFTNPVCAPLPHDPLASSSKGGRSRGLGQGLYLVQRICDAVGWQVETHVKDGMFAVELYYKPA